MELGGITYRLRAPSGDKETENSEWNVMRTKAKDQTFFDAIRDTSYYAMMQDTTSNGSYISRDWQYGFSQTYNKNNKNNGYYTPVLEILAGADIHPVTVDLGGGFVEEGKGTLKLAVSADGFTAPSTQGISGMSGTLVWQGDNGVIYNPGETVPPAPCRPLRCAQSWRLPPSRPAPRPCRARRPASPWRRRARWAISGR